MVKKLHSPPSTEIIGLVCCLCSLHSLRNDFDIWFRFVQSSRKNKIGYMNVSETLALLADTFLFEKIALIPIAERVFNSLTLVIDKDPLLEEPNEIDYFYLVNYFLTFRSYLLIFVHIFNCYDIEKKQGYEPFRLAIRSLFIILYQIKTF